MNRCIPHDQFQRLLAEQMSPAERCALDAHVDVCGRCQDSFARLLDAREQEATEVNLRLLRSVAPAPTEELPGHFRHRLQEVLADTTTNGCAHLRPAAELVFPGLPTPLGPLGRLDSYHIAAELGRGAFGLVFKAYDEQLNRPVALKVLRPELAASSSDRLRFESEARKAAAVCHEHVVAIHLVGNTPDFPLPYFVMEYIDGEALSGQLHRSGALESREAASIVHQAAVGLAAAHTRGLVHRDIKPSNILLERATGRVKVTDFGLARTLDARTERFTQSGAIVGTPQYMSPEQVAAPERIDRRSDVYSLGAVLYETLTGEPPFRGVSHMVLQQVVHDEPRPPRRLNDSIPRDLETICLCCLRKEPEKRYPDAAALAGDLRRFLDGEPPCARPVSGWERALKWARRRPAIAGLSAAVIAVTAVSFGLVTWQWRQAEAARRGLATTAEELEVKNYFTRIALADRELAVQNAGRAEELLDECPSGRRGWEWHYLKRLRHAPPATLPLGQRVVMGEGFDLAISPDSHLLAIPAANNEIRVWNLLTSRRVLTLHGHGARVLAVAFSPDGRRLASTSEDKTVKLWDMTIPGSLDGAGALSVLAPARTLAGHTDRITGVAFSPDGLVLASAGNDKLVKLWDAVTGRLIRDFPGQTIPNPYARLAFSPDGRRLASGTTHNAVGVWDVPSGREVFTLSGHAQPILSAAFSPDGQRLVSAGRDRKVLVWDLAGDEGRVVTPRYVVRPLSLGVWCAALSPDGRRLAVGGPMSDGMVRVYDAATGRLLLKLQGHIRVVSVAFSPDGRRLASAGLDKLVRLWETKTGQEVLTLRGHTDLVGRVLFSPDGQRLVSASADGMVRVWDASSFDESADRHVLTVREDGGTIYGLAFSPDSQRLASAGSDHMVRVRDTETGRQVRLLPGHKAPVFSVAYSLDPKGRDRLLSASNDQTVKLWDPRTGHELFTLSGFSGMVRTLAFAPDGETFATGSVQMLQLWDAQDGRPRVPPQYADAEHVECVAFSPGGKYLATAGSHRNVQLWEVADGKLKLSHACKGHGTKVFSVAFSPDGRLMASGDFDGNVNVWDCASGDKKYSLDKQTDCISGIAFSPDGRHLATASWKEVVIWDAKTFKPIHTLGGLAGTIWSVVFSPDGQRLAAGGGYKDKAEIKIWDKTLWDDGASP